MTDNSKKEISDVTGFYNIKKPSGITSHDVVDEVRKVTGIKKVGHAGTLDPMAKGVLVIAVGREFTKKINNQKNKEKEYIAEIELGKKSDTCDKTGNVEFVSSRCPEKAEVVKVLKSFVGDIIQKTPAYSAVKVSGVRNYKRARKGNIFRPPRKVTVKNIDLLEYQYPKVKIRIVTGPGVYIRAIARDLGERLETGGMLISLTRTRVGDFKIEDARSLDQIKNR